MDGCMRCRQSNEPHTRVLTMKPIARKRMQRVSLDY
jgi:hypothetical protein